MIVDCVSDLHGHYPELDGGDLLIIAGDFTARGCSEEYVEFTQWLTKQDYKKIITIAGNHDNFRQRCPPPMNDHSMRIEYLCDSGTEFEGLKIWGSPWTRTFEGMNPYCKAFTIETEEELAKKWALIPDDIDILITHSPPYGILDKVPADSKINKGSTSLLVRLIEIDPSVHCFGHIHEDYGLIYQPVFADRKERWRINASHVNERYEPVNKPIRIIL